MRKSACIYFFYHLFFRQKGKRNRPTFLRNGEDMSIFAKMVSCTTPVASRPKLSNGKLEKSRVARRSTRRERNRLARFALEDDSEGDFSSVSFNNKGGEKDADAEAEEIDAKLAEVTAIVNTVLGGGGGGGDDGGFDDEAEFDFDL